MSSAEPEADSSASAPATAAASMIFGSAMLSMTISSGGADMPPPDRGRLGRQRPPQHRDLGRAKHIDVELAAEQRRARPHDLDAVELGATRRRGRRQ